NIQLLDPSNNPIALTDGSGNPLPGVTLTSDATNTVWTLTFPAQKKLGSYTLKVGPNLHGNVKMDQNQNGTLGESGDQFVTDPGPLTVTGLHVITYSPQGSVINPPGVGSFVVTFNEGVLDSSFTTNQVTVSGPGGVLPKALVSVTGSGAVWQ